MAGRSRVGLWFPPGLDHALAARAALGELQAMHPDSDWVLFGPRASLFLFEMDERVPVYIPLRALEPRRPAQTRLSYFLEKRAQFKKLRALELHSCFGVAALSPNLASNEQIHNQFQRMQKALGVGGGLVQKALEEWLSVARPTLQAGPQSLAFATQHHRKTPPNQAKTLVLLMDNGLQTNTIEQQWQEISGSAEFAAWANPTVAVVLNGQRLAARRISNAHPDWLQLDMAQAMGLIAYADGVICASAQITRICAEMGRSDRVLLGKSHI